MGATFLDDWRNIAEMYTETGGIEVPVMQLLDTEKPCITCKHMIIAGDVIYSMPATTNGEPAIHRQHAQCQPGIITDNYAEEETEYDDDSGDDYNTKIPVIELLTGGTRCVQCKNEFVEREIIEIQTRIMNGVPLLIHKHDECPDNTEQKK